MSRHDAERAGWRMQRVYDDLCGAYDAWTGPNGETTDWDEPYPPELERLLALPEKGSSDA